MLTVCGKIVAVRKSTSGKSLAVNVGNTWIHVSSDDADAFKNAIGTGEPVEVRARTELVVDEQGVPKARVFKKRDGTTGTGPDIRVRYWYRAPGSGTPLDDLLGSEAAAGTADTGDDAK